MLENILVSTGPSVVNAVPLISADLHACVHAVGQIGTCMCNAVEGAADHTYLV